MKIPVVDRQSGQHFFEEVYGGGAIRALYGPGIVSAILRRLVRYPVISACYGWVQRMGWTKRLIRPFIEQYNVDEGEFLDSTDTFESFDAFFVRRLKPNLRPVAATDAVIPADGRYQFFTQIDAEKGVDVKGQRLDLGELLGDATFAQCYHGGVMVMARLAPVDYHRFHFCADGEVSRPSLVNGYLYSVNPYAIRQNLRIFVENKRVISTLDTKYFGKVVTVAVGATNVGNIVHNHRLGGSVKKGEEKGYFSFGGSALILLFAPNTIELEQDLIQCTAKGMEVRCLVGQSLGRAVRNSV